MTFIPQFPTYPPEKAWMREPKTDIPGLIIKTGANGGELLLYQPTLTGSLAVPIFPTMETCSKPYSMGLQKMTFL
jgi:hypothetical protein